MAGTHALLVILTVLPTIRATPRALKFRQLPGYSDVLLNGDLLFHSPATSSLECGQSCSQTDHCMVFTYVQSNAGEAASACRGYADLKTTSLTSAPGARSYSFVQDWLSRSCTTDKDCETRLPVDYKTTLGERPDPVCFQGLCLCYPGYFYSVDKQLCVQDCSNAALHDSYTRYPTSGITGRNHYVTQATVDECKTFCSSIVDCENFEILTSSDPATRRNCIGARVSGYSEGFSTPDYGWDYYQRNCA